MAIERKRRLGPSVLATLCALLPALHTGVAVAASCSADSGHVRNALVELYTSEGCSSCPPADRALHRLTADRPRVIPLAMHVDYWDSIGWKDRFAQPPFAERQRWEVRANQHRTSFTPHFFVNGREVEDWRADLDAGLRADRRQASAQIAIAAESAGGRCPEGPRGRQRDAGRRRARSACALRGGHRRWLEFAGRRRRESRCASRTRRGRAKLDRSDRRRSGPGVDRSGSQGAGSGERQYPRGRVHPGHDERGSAAGGRYRRLSPLMNGRSLSASTNQS